MQLLLPNPNYLLRIDQALDISHLLALRNFPIAHPCPDGLHIHRRQSLGWRWIRFRVERVKTVGSGEPDSTIPHDW